ncbi:MAG TPA: glucoamylase family protein, partial [Gemmatimonadaceae bacterium]|nr:glucoamylase family protein [Gemmatimonadaceae bacterium]
MPPAATLERILSRLFPIREAAEQSQIPGPIRGELLGADHLATRARQLAKSQRLEAKPRRWRRAPLLARLSETNQILLRAHDRLTRASEQEIDVGPAGEWLLDNHHVVQEHVREVRESLPPGYYRELPELASGTLAGYPRVYEIATTLIAHTEGRIDLENTHLFIGAFQEASPLALGELWAMPAMLRLGLIENIRRMALRTVQRLDEVELADRWAARLLERAGPGPLGFTAGLREFVNAPPRLTPTFVSRFLQQLRQAPTTYAPLAWLESWIADEGLSAEEAGARSAQRLALTQVMTANSISSLRAIGRMDWRQFVERQSQAEAVLRQDPSGDYARMTFATRDHYRHIVERIAKRTKQGEPAVAGEALRLAREADAARTADHRRRHIGFWLISSGLADLERTTGYRPTFRERTHRWTLRHPNLIFFGGIVAALAGVLALLYAATGRQSTIAAPVLLALALIPASEIAVNLVNQLVAIWLPPRVLPKLELHEKGGIPPELRTAVVIPTLFGSVEAVRDGLDTLEVRYLANREPNLHFAILSDFTDSPTETREGDDDILRAAIEGVRALNARYAPGRDDAFYLFHRSRLWNERQGVWMGWERKRGKLAQFNRFVRGEEDGSAFTTIVGDTTPLREVKYVITLDSDTILPPDAAPLLVGAIAHPLNRAVFDPALGRVVEGYGIIQPRVGVALPSAHKSLFAAIHSGHPGVDPYTTAVSDVYQDLFGEGSFTGKGIYDVAAFEEATHGRFPENMLLSHDLIEGNYARAGLATDVEVFDDYPTRYLTYTRRKHRWIRGDWQLLDWLTPRVPGPSGPEQNRLSALSRWKILDNLRRSLVEISQLLLFVGAWTVLPGSRVRWTLLALATVAAPWIISITIAVVRPPFDKSWRAYYRSVWRDAVTSAQQLALAIAFLPHQAWVSADAIVRTLWRLGVSRRSLLEWQTASQTERVVSGASRDVWRTMWPTVAIAFAILLGIVADAGIASRVAADWWHPLAIGAAPLALWIASPAIAHALSRPAIRRELRLDESQTADARRFALLHWRFFDRFVNEGTHWLAPDNYQDDPEPVVAMRTSPTNIGLQLLSTVSAYDLGFITIEEMTARLENAFRSLERLRRFRGHFYNWYALDDLRVLEPAYVSTVDSGNLAGHFLALRQACLTIPDIVLGTRRTGWAMDAALAIAADRLGRIASYGAAETPAQFQAVATAAREVRDAQRALAARGREGFDTVAAPLERARETLAKAGLDEEISRPAIGWIEWSLRRISTAHEEPPADGKVTLRDHARTRPAIVDTIARLETIAHRAAAYAAEMDFRFLFDERRKLFSIGYHVGSHQLDGSFYDLLASEARLASFVAIAKNDVPVEHWFRLGRTLTHTAGATAMVSWSGSMFEYLMPLLVMQTFPFTLLDQTYHGAVRRQIAYAAERDAPWGISESAYNVRDRHFTYQYRAFGVPDLALKRGLGRDLVIAPYAAALAVMVEPRRALENLVALDKLGAVGEFGFHDALDFTRPDPGERFAIVRNYMAHHVGMGLVSLTNALTMQLWQRRFHADPVARSAELLLHERVPRRLLLQEPQEARAEEPLPDAELDRPAVREVTSPNTPQPVVALLGHLPYTVMVSACGSGYSRYEGLAVTRWRADGTRDNTGQFAYVRDVDTGHVWSTAFQPTCVPPEWYRAHLATDRVTLHRADGPIETRTEIAVVPEDSAEVRRVTITNNGSEPREIEVTSYGEIVIAPADADRNHPAFSNLFVETEWHEWCTAITATRRPRSAKEPRVWLVHVVDSGREGERVGPATCETDRARFIGRGRTTRDPVALDADGPLSMTTGAVLDPIFALRTRVRVAAGQSASVAFTTIVATTRERCFELADRYHHPHAAQRALDLAWTSTQVELRELGVSPADAAIFQELAGHLFYATPALRATTEELEQNHGSQPLLWKAGVSGDWPILLATIDSDDGLPTLRQLLNAHHYWRRRGMVVDLVVLNTRTHSYLQDLNDKVTATVLASAGAALVDRPGGVFIRRADIVGDDTLRMLRGTARVVVTCDGRSLSRALDAAESGSAAPSDVAEETPRMAARATPIGTRIVRRITSLAGGGNGGGNGAASKPA